jgi:hypothetical protein
MTPDPKRMREWATVGAATRLAQLDAERAEILRRFPNLPRRVRAALIGLRWRKQVSAKARKAMSAGMRRYWAKRKASERP